MHSKLFSHNFHFDPAPDGAASGAASPGLPAGGDAAPAFDASKFVPREELDSLRGEYSEFRQTAEQRFQDYDSRLPKPAKPEVKEDKEPDAEDGTWDFTKPGEFSRFQRETAKFHINQTLSERDKSQSEAQREQGYKQYVQSTQDAHAERADSFRAANPDYDPNKSVLLGNDTVALAVLESEFSAHIHNFLQKNPAKVAEIRKMTPAAAVRAIGRIEAQFETQTTAPQNKRVAAAAAPTVGGFGGSKPSGQPAKTKEQIFDDFHK